MTVWRCHAFVLSLVSTVNLLSTTAEDSGELWSIWEMGPVCWIDPGNTTDWWEIPRHPCWPGIPSMTLITSTLPALHLLTLSSLLSSSRSRFIERALVLTLLVFLELTEGDLIQWACGALWKLEDWYRLGSLVGEIQKGIVGCPLVRVWGDIKSEGLLVIVGGLGYPAQIWWCEQREMFGQNCGAFPNNSWLSLSSFVLFLCESFPSVVSLTFMPSSFSSFFSFFVIMDSPLTFSSFSLSSFSFTSTLCPSSTLKLLALTGSCLESSSTLLPCKWVLRHFLCLCVTAEIIDIGKKSLAFRSFLEPEESWKI